jgi:3-deoxy-D-manno-octulosonic-acid transferase
MPTMRLRRRRRSKRRSDPAPTVTEDQGTTTAGTAWRRLYTLLVALLVPFALLRLLWRSRSAPAYRHRWLERLAAEPRPPERADVWVHAVSVGEVQAALPLLKHLLRRGLRVLVTTTTPTGAARLRELLGDAVQHRYTPFDLPGVMRRFLDRVSPRLVLVMETEIWPNMLAACAERGARQHAHQRPALGALGEGLRPTRYA